MILFRRDKWRVFLLPHLQRSVALPSLSQWFSCGSYWLLGLLLWTSWDPGVWNFSFQWLSVVFMFCMCWCCVHYWGLGCLGGLGSRELPAKLPLVGVKEAVGWIPTISPFSVIVFKWAYLFSSLGGNLDNEYVNSCNTWHLVVSFQGNRNWGWES